MSERLEFGFAYSIDPDLWPDREEAKIIARKVFFDTSGEGPFPDGILIAARWRNPDNKNPRHANWKTTNDPGQSLPDFYHTLHGNRGALAQAYYQTQEEYRRVGPIARQRKAHKKTTRKRVSKVAKQKRK